MAKQAGYLPGTQLLRTTLDDSFALNLTSSVISAMCPCRNHTREHYDLLVNIQEMICMYLQSMFTYLESVNNSKSQM